MPSTSDADLIARRRQILAMLVVERQRLDRGGNARIVTSIKCMVKALKKELADVEAELEIAVRGSPVWAASEKLLVSVPGVGPGTARTLLAGLPRSAGLIDGRSPPLSVWRHSSANRAPGGERA